MNVLLLGAGCSKSYSASPTGVRMPLARDFFQTYNRLKISENPWVLVGNILNVAHARLGIEPIDFVHADFDIEEFHSMIEQTMLQLLEMPRESMTPELHENLYEHWKAYSELIFLFASVINEIQNGPISETHMRLARCVQEGDRIITFNWDTLMDRALAEVHRWCVDTGYGVTPRGVFRNGWVSPACEHLGDIPILKLHGSSNWITSAPTNDQNGAITLTQRADPSTFYVYECSDQPYATYDGRYMPGYEPYSYGYYPPNIMGDPGKPAREGYVFVRAKPRFPWMPRGTADARGLTSMPLIIPPVKQKQYALFGSLFEQLWRLAETALTRCDRLIIIGYSFPRTDLRSNELIMQAFLKRHAPPQIVIVDPKPDDVAHLFTHVFGAPASNVRTFREYWSETSDPTRLFA